MPQALDAQRDLMEKWFGCPVADDGPYLFLRARGYTDDAGHLSPPTKSHSISDYEWECIAFLCDEWDYSFTPTKDPLR